MSWVLYGKKSREREQSFDCNTITKGQENRMSDVTGQTFLPEAELKSLLQQGEVEEGKQLDVLLAMVEHIGTPDPVLRDKLIYTTFYRLIIEEDRLHTEVLKDLLDLSMDHLLMKGIGEEGTDSVFTRAFTTLLMALVLGRDKEADFLSEDKIQEAADITVEYLEQEQDVRGFVEEKGWAHSVAHAADMVDELVLNPKVDQDMFPVLLKALWEKVLVSHHAYIHDEDERLLVPILQMIWQGMDEGEVITLVEKLPEMLEKQKADLEEEAYWTLFFNVKTFSKTFYMKLEDYPTLSKLRDAIDRVLKELN